MVVDTSAIVALVFKEPGFEDLENKLAMATAVRGKNEVIIVVPRGCLRKMDVIDGVDCMDAA